MGGRKWSNGLKLVVKTLRSGSRAVAKIRGQCNTASSWESSLLACNGFPYTLIALPRGIWDLATAFICSLDSWPLPIRIFTGKTGPRRH